MTMYQRQIKPLKCIYMRIIKMKLSGSIVTGTFAMVIALLFAFVPFPQKKERIVPPDAAKEKNPIKINASSLSAGKNIYNLKCVACHGIKGKGDGPKSGEFDEKPQDFTDANFRKQSDGALCWKITLGNTTMPCFKHQMTKEQRWQVIAYIRTL
jgi:mono/diheme cytochrome c family protein